LNKTDRLVFLKLFINPSQLFIGPGAKNEAKLLELKTLTAKQKDDLDRAKRYSLEVSTRHTLMKQRKSEQENQMKVSQMTQALSLMARIYVGSISPDVREEEIRRAFSVFGPIKSLNMTYTSTGVSFK
jgi:RNA recognition motif-containing protein